MSEGALDQFQEDLQAAKAICENFRASLPNVVDIAALGVWSKAPYKALTIREALIWRTQELGTVACESLMRGDQAAGLLLSRAVIESAALIWRLKCLLEERKQTTTEELHKTLDKMLLGWRSEKDFPQATNILTLIDSLDKAIPGVRETYDSLSEVAHPNYSGVLGLYSQTDRKNFRTHFGKGLRGDDRAKGACHALVGSLGLFELAYNRIADILEVWLTELSPLSGPPASDGN